MWFFVTAPPVLAFLFDPHCAMNVSNVFRALAAITLYTCITGFAVHHAFEIAAQRFASWNRAARLLAHALVNICVVAVATAAQLWYLLLIYPEMGNDGWGVLWRGLLVSFVYLGLASFVGHLQRTAVQHSLQANFERTAALEARLAMLQAQMQPHFLFNSLNVCAGLVHTAPDAAEATLDRLAGFLRYALESTERRFVPLKDELDAVEAYLDVQRERFGARLKYELLSGSSTNSVAIPPMLLQPLVENALLHGLHREEGGKIRVATEREGRNLIIKIDDDGVGPGASTHKGTGSGMRNVRERLQLVYGERANLQSGASSMGGFNCTIVLNEAFA